MATRMQQRRGTAAQWSSTDPILAAGEIGFESDSGKFKIGDGVNHWSVLSYFANAAEISNLIDGAPDLLNTLNELAAAIGDDPSFFATVATDLSNHASTTTNVHGIADTSALATKTYADGKASSAQSAAQSFATSADSTLHTTITGEIATAKSQAITAAENYADSLASDYDAAGSATSAKNDAKSYADGLISTEVTDRNSAIATAKSQAITTAEGYTDNAISNLVNGAPAVLDTLKELSDALGADKNFSTTVAENIASAKSDAESYTDSAISTEVTNRNTAIATAKSQAISTSESYADTKKSEAITAAEGYTDSAISTEVTNRNSAIATAKSEAISSAASDATTKANNAKSGAESTAASALASHEADTTNIHGITDTAELATKTFAAELLTNATKSNITITGNKNGLTITAENGVADSTTDDLVEGSSNLYFTNERAQDAIGLNVGTGLTYTDSTGEIKVTPNTYDIYGAADNVLSGLVDHESKTTNVHGIADVDNLATKSFVLGTVTGAVGSLTKSDIGLGNANNTSDADKPISTATQTALDLKAPKASPTFTGTLTAATGEFTGNLTVDGNLTISGTTTTVNTQNLNVEDPLIYVGDNNSGNSVDLGIVSAFNDGTYQHTGLVRDASDSKWKLFKGVTDEPTTTINFNQGSLDTLAVGLLEGVAHLSGTSTAPTATLGTDTTQIATTAFVNAAVANLVNLNLVLDAGVVS